MKHFFRHHKLETLFFFIPWGVYFLFLWSHILFTQDGKLYAGHPYVWADWSMHISLAANFAFRPMAHWFDSLPVFSMSPVTYPFMTNLISGLLWKLGLSLPVSFILPSLLSTALMLVMVFTVCLSFLGSKKRAIVSATLFFCGGGFGVFRILFDKGPRALLDSTQSLTQIDTYHIDMNTIIPSMLIPQRAFLLGFPIGLFVLWILGRQFLFHKNTVRPPMLVFTGILAGISPIIHTHTYLVIVFFSFWILLASMSRIREWLYFALPATVLSLLMYVVFLRTGVLATTFFSIHPGWAGAGSFSYWIFFWLQNWGLFLPVALLGTARLYLDKKYKLVYLVGFFWVLFLLANYIQFQPQQWDNTKLFAWVYFGLSIAVVWAITWVAHLPQKRVALVSTWVLLGLLCASGSIDLIHNLDFKQKTFEMLSKDQVALGLYTRANTNPNAIFLSRPIVSNPISMIGGRSVYLGYPGWAFSYGLNYAQRERDISDIFAGNHTISQVKELTGATYVYIEKNEAETKWITGDPMARQVFENNAGTIYAIQ